MDLSQDNQLYKGGEARSVFKYEEAPTTVVRLSPDFETPLIWTMKNDHDWDKWFGTEHPKIDGSASGLVLILARRNGERRLPSVNRAGSNEWLEIVSHCQPEVEPSSEKATGTTTSTMSGSRKSRILPFSERSFRKIVDNFYIHDTIARVVNRADMPIFSAVELEMGQNHGQEYPAFVYNGRTSNAWDKDLAFSATYFPHCGLTFAVMFGCPMSVEVQILKRLSKVRSEASHPLLMPGIFVELERLRHNRLVDDTINDLEARIQEIDEVSQDAEILSAEENASRKEARRSAWLDTTYLRNQLINWITYLERLINHADELNRTIFNIPEVQTVAFDEYLREHTKPLKIARECPYIRSCSLRPEAQSCDGLSAGRTKMDIGEDYRAESRYSANYELEFPFQLQKESKIEADQSDVDISEETMRRIGKKIRNRVQDIIDEYHEKVRDCTMRVDGMAMATQWAQGETNMEIARAASRDSRHMRSIALVTMIFLPGTFFASMFSMDFFNWSPGSGEVVSKYFWIYVVLAVTFTFVTIGSWWYLGVYRYSQRQRKKRAMEMELCPA